VFALKNKILIFANIGVLLCKPLAGAQIIIGTSVLRKPLFRHT